MTQKLVTYKIAKALKEAGYPQEFNVFGGTTCHYKNENTIQYHSAIGSYENVECAAPTYTSAWLWLWKEKKICINCNLDKYNLIPQWWCNNENGISYNTPNFDDPEEAIIATIEYLVENNLIK